MRIDYHMLLMEISKKQGLGTTATEMPVIICTKIATYPCAYLLYEDEDYLIIVITDQEGAELAKILRKDTILSVEVIYQQMLQKPKNPKGDVSYA